MPITSHVGPLDGRSILEQALSTRQGAAPAMAAPLGGTPFAGSPLPVYHLALHDLDGEAPLDRAVRTGWRYPVVGGLEPGLADIREAASGRGASSFGGLSQGLLPRRLLEASQLAETALAGRAQSYEPRMLEVPAVLFSALWLHGADDEAFVSLLDGLPPGSATLELRADVVAELRARAATRARQGANPRPAGPAASGSATPTN